MALPGGGSSNEALAQALPVLLDSDAVTACAELRWARDTALLPLLRSTHARASRAQLASVLACTCRAVRARADATTLGDAAHRAALGQQARAMRAVLTAILHTPLESDSDAQAALTEQCGAGFADRTSAAAWREYEAEVLAAMAQANATAKRAAAMAHLRATGRPDGDPDTVPSFITGPGGMAASFAGEEYERAYDEVFWLLERGPDTAEEEPEESNVGGALWQILCRAMEAIRAAPLLSILLVVVLAVLSRYFNPSPVEVAPPRH
jgi:hypothetical protein